MNLHKLILTENDCYKAGKKIVPKGIMVHSTAANNPNLCRYVGPDDGLLGVNRYNNHWNNGGLSVCVHAFIGKLKDGTIATYQTLPWDHRGWHAGGDANNTHISFEICEDDTTGSAYFKQVYREAVELCAYLCKEYGLTEKDIIDHSEGCKQGIASAHGDVGHWFPKHGASMDTFRADVKALLEKEDKPTYTHENFLKELQEALGAPVTGKPDLVTLGMTVAVSAKVNPKHAAVKPLQKWLNALGYEEVGTADGEAGPKFTSAVLHYQMDHGCTQTGALQDWDKTWHQLIWG